APRLPGSRARHEREALEVALAAPVGEGELRDHRRELGRSRAASEHARPRTSDRGALLRRSRLGKDRQPGRKASRRQRREPHAALSYGKSVQHPEAPLRVDSDTPPIAALTRRVSREPPQTTAPAPLTVPLDADVEDRAVSVNPTRRSLNGVVGLVP